MSTVHAHDLNIWYVQTLVADQSEINHQSPKENNIVVKTMSTVHVHDLNSWHIPALVAYQSEINHQSPKENKLLSRQ